MNGIQDESENSLLKNNSNNNLGGLLSLNSNDFSFLNPTVLNNSLLYNFPSLIDKSNQLLNPNKGNSSFSNINKEVSSSKFSPVEDSIRTNSDKLGTSTSNETQKQSNSFVKLEVDSTTESKNTGKKRFMKAYEKVSETK